ncbi:hypothetical protein FACS1894105_09140 [Clostridia bacterium]|nr:hypothetical protein FACS1894105_09140 [Clostridia bacterium]
MTNPLPKTIKADDTTLQETLGDLAIRGVIPYGADIYGVRVIAGNGTSVEFRSAEQFAQMYGGVSSKWQKKAGLVKTDNHRYDVHWSEYDGEQYEAKIKPPIQEVKNEN